MESHQYHVAVVVTGVRAAKAMRQEHSKPQQQSKQGRMVASKKEATGHTQRCEASQERRQKLWRNATATCDKCLAAMRARKNTQKSVAQQQILRILSIVEK